MKQSEKLDLILQTLYELRVTGQPQFLKTICENSGVPLVSRDELYILAKRLENDNLVECHYIGAGVMAILNSYGIEYCEEDSYSYKGTPLIMNTYNLTISNSPQANIVSASTGVSVQNNFQGELKHKINEFRKLVAEDVNVDETQKQEINECLEEVESALNAGRKPKFSFKQLSELASNVAGVSSLLLQIGQMIMSQPG
ncbi:hypothetical protein [Hymenobacter sp. B1770]|uniref:hypothetical protein n=1 Tax=Hymenobacter sp. B1770 TaxID=1718788 RepID=UPI003CF46693